MLLERAAEPPSRCPAWRSACKSVADARAPVLLVADHAASCGPGTSTRHRRDGERHARPLPGLGWALQDMDAPARARARRGQSDSRGGDCDQNHGVAMGPPDGSFLARRALDAASSASAAAAGWTAGRAGALKGRGLSRRPRSRRLVITGGLMSVIPPEHRLQHGVAPWPGVRAAARRSAMAPIKAAMDEPRATPESAS